MSQPIKTVATRLKDNISWPGCQAPAAAGIVILSTVKPHLSAESRILLEFCGLTGNYCTDSLNHGLVMFFMSELELLVAQGGEKN